MHILVSDYDGTLYTNGQLIGDVPAAVDLWRKNGNHFGIATGRDFSMTRPEIERWGIAIDFLVCINGAAVYDDEYSLLYSRFLEDDIVPAILLHPAGLASQHYQFSGLEPLRVLLRDGSLFWDSDIRFQNVDLEQAMAIRNVGQISLAYPTEEESIKWTAALNRDLDGHIEAHRNKRMIDVTRNGVDKATGIAGVLAAKHWPAENVHTVGDGNNDIPMLKAYDGYTVRGASEDVVRVVHKQYGDVPELVAALS